MGHQVNMHPPSSMDSVFDNMFGGLGTRVIDVLAPLLKKTVQEEVGEIKSHMVERPISVTQAAEYLGVAEKTLYQWISKGIIPSSVTHKVNGKRLFFFPSELQQFIKKS